VNAVELLAAVAGLPGSRSVALTGDEILESRLLAGVEVARVGDPDEKELRKLWQARHGNGTTPLLLVSDDTDAPETLRALGPLSHDGPVRVVSAENLLRLLERLPALEKLQAVRELAEELDRLDQAGISGLQVRGLGPDHLFRERLRKDNRWQELADLSAELPTEWRALLEALGYTLEQLPVRGYLLRFEDAPVAVVRPLADADAFAKLDAEGRPPEGVLVEDCIREGVDYGLLASGGRLRLFDARPETGSSVARYLDLDAASLTDEDRPLLGLLAPEYLVRGGFARLLREARDFGSKLRERIDRALRQDVLPVLGRELGRWARNEGVDLTDDARRAELEAASLTFAFRALFLLFAESSRFLPIEHESYRPHSLTQIVREAHEQRAELGERSTSLWDRMKLLVHTLRDGNPAWLVPAYNGTLFAPDGFAGSEILERAAIVDSDLGPALAALGIDPETESGYDFSGLEIGHLGHIYEGLLSLRLTVADQPYSYDAKADRYRPTEEEQPDAAAGDLLWLTDEGGRKGGGVYYTPEALVRHLVRRGVVPAFERHLEEVAALAETKPDDAARKLLEFRVLDPACGSAHFLVAVVDELSATVARFLARTPLPAIRSELADLRAGAGDSYGVGIEDQALLRRLVLKHCVYGVDLSPMGAEIAKISLWLASFVPGLSLAYLDHNVKVGNSLIGAGDLESATDFAGDIVREAVKKGAVLADELAESRDRTPDEVQASRDLESKREAIVEQAKALLDEWLPAAVLDSRPFHWPLEFPEVFEYGGFDAVVGNPPWEQIRTDEVSFFLHYQPGLKALPERERVDALSQLRAERSDLEARFQRELTRLEGLRAYWNAEQDVPKSGGFPDLFKLFCRRYDRLLREDATLAVVLPRAAFGIKGATDFRDWLFHSNSPERIDFLLNSGRWAFDAEPRYTVALVIARALKPVTKASFELAGVASSAEAFKEQISAPGLFLRTDALGPHLEVPALSSGAEASLLAKLRGSGEPFPFGCSRWSCFPVQELNEKFDRELWEQADEGWALWKGESFDQYDPDGAGARWCPFDEAVRNKVVKTRPGSGSLLAERFSTTQRVEALKAEIGRCRVAFRDVSRATDSRTIRAALIPPSTLLTNTAPYLVFVEGGDVDRACCLGILNSLVFDWQARRFVETHVNFFVLEGLHVPSLADDAYGSIACAAARLSCPDERFADFATSAGVEVGPMSDEDRDELRAEIDARVAHAWGLGRDELDTVLSDFTLAAVPEDYRARVRGKLAALGS
jgi:Eco57I restriction-modification methylase